MQFDVRKVGSDWWLEAFDLTTRNLVRKFPTKRAAMAARTIMVGKWIPLDCAIQVIADDARKSMRVLNVDFRKGLAMEAESFAITFGFNAGLPFPESSRLEEKLAELIR